MNEEVKRLYQEARKKPYQEKSEWEKAIFNHSNKTRKRRNKERKHEILFDPSDLEKYF